MNKITIIGTGSVGATIAYTLAVTGLGSEIVMIDINKKRAFGEALDIRQGTPFCRPCAIYDGDYTDAKDSDIVIITSGIPRKAGQSRLELAQTNINVMKSIIPEITRHAPEAMYIIVSNPVDVLTYTFCKCSGIPENRILGTGTVLDTARLRAYLSDYYSLNDTNVHAYVLGEHGDSSFIPWSLANIANIPINECHNVFDKTHHEMLNFDEVEEHVRKSGGKIIEGKGATFYAVSMSVAHICRSLLSGVETTMTISTMMHGEYGIDDVCLSVLNTVGRDGVSKKILLPLNDKEVALLRNSADKLKEIIHNAEI